MLLKQSLGKGSVEWFAVAFPALSQDRNLKFLQGVSNKLTKPIVDWASSIIQSPNVAHLNLYPITKQTTFQCWPPK